MEPILTGLQRRLSALTPAQRTAVAAELGISRTLIPKLLGGHRENPRVQTIQPLIDFFAAVDRGERALPGAVADVAATETH